MTKDSRPGRPKKPADEVRSAKLEIRLTESEKELIDKAVGSGVSAWARKLLIAAAKRLLGRK